jgi:threonyl-tRNA synthetase
MILALSACRFRLCYLCVDVFAPLGTHERFIGFLIEHYAGNFPLWLAPDQVRGITLNDDEALINYAKPIVAELRANMVRVDADFSATPFKAKISNADRLRSFPPTHVGGYGWSSADATWKPAR